MTKEENIAILNEHLDHWKRLLSEKICDRDEGEKTIDALHNAIKALEQEPCEDCISRHAALDLVADYDLSMGQVVKGIHALPSVTPAEKVGQWVFVKGYEGLLYECIVCRNKNTHTTVRWNYCPHCGAKMEEVEENSCSNCKFWCLDKNDESRRCQYCYHQDEWQPESEDKE